MCTQKNNHPLLIIKNTPAAVNKRLNNISINAEVFKDEFYFCLAFGNHFTIGWDPYFSVEADYGAIDGT